MSTITLDELIQQGKELKPALRNVQGVGGFSWYEWSSDEHQESYSSWKNTCKRFLAGNFQNDISHNDFEKAIKQFEEGEKYPEDFQEIIGVLQGYKSIPSIIKINSNSSNTNSNKNSVNVHVNNNNSNSQQQSQEQKLAFDLFISAIDDELTGKQRKELKAYLEESKELPEAERKQGIVEKLKSFGKDLGLNILANIITNPSIWGGL